MVEGLSAEDRREFYGAGADGDDWEVIEPESRLLDFYSDANPDDGREYYSQGLESCREQDVIEVCEGIIAERLGFER